MKPLFITCEGGEGSGKSSVIENLKDTLDKDKFVFVNDPSSCSRELLAIRSILLSGSYSYLPKTELLLYIASRSELIHSKILPAIKESKHVICDRFYDSTRIYQCYLKGHSEEVLFETHKMFCEDIHPDLTFLFNVDAKLGLQRSNKKLIEQNLDESRWEDMGLEIHEKINAQYLKIAENENRFIIIDSNKNSVDKMTNIVYDYIKIFVNMNII